MTQHPSTFQNKFVADFNIEVDTLHLQYGWSKSATKKDIENYEKTEWIAYCNQRKENPKNKMGFTEFRQNKLIHKHKVGDIILDKQSNFVIPKTAIERNDLLKSFPAKWWFYHYKVHYLNLSLSDNDLNSINAQINELELIIKHEKIIDPIKIGILYTDAREYCHMPNIGKFRNLTTEQIELYIYILHKNDFFNSFLLSEHSLNYRDPTDRIYAEVYGKYILFYEYLLKQKQRLEKGFKNIISKKEIENFRKLLPSESLKEIFYQDAVELFYSIENRLIESGYFVTPKKWIKEKNMLVALILSIKLKGYLHPIKDKNKNNYYRRFFENRYDIDIRKQMQPKQIKKYNLPNSYEAELFFIQNIK